MATLPRNLPPKFRLPFLVIGLIGTAILATYLKSKNVPLEIILSIVALLITFFLGGYFQRKPWY